MANREKGEVALVSDGREYTLLLDTNALAALEEHFSTREREVTFTDVLERVNAGSIRAIRALIWGALQAHHPGTSIEEAGRVIQGAGGLMGLTQQLNALGMSTTPDPADLEALGIDPTRPRKARAGRRRGTGASSTSTLAASA